MIPGLIHKAYLAKKEGKPLVVFGNGKPLRQFIYSEDLAKLFIWAIREYEEIEPIVFCGMLKWFEMYNSNKICNSSNAPFLLTVDESDEIPIIEVAEMIAAAFQLEQGIVLDETKAIGQFRKTASNRKLRKYLPDFQFTPLREALQTTVDWFIQNYNTVRKWFILLRA